MRQLWVMKQIFYRNEPLEQPLYSWLLGKPRIISCHMWPDSRQQLHLVIQQSKQTGYRRAGHVGRRADRRVAAGLLVRRRSPDRPRVPAGPATRAR